MRAIVAQAIRTKPYAEWARIRDRRRALRPGRQTEEGIDDPQVQSNAMVVELQDPEVGSMTQMGVPAGSRRPPGSCQSRASFPVPRDDV